MATIKRFEDIEAWQLARGLCKEIWGIINNGTFSKDWGLKDQISRSSGSVMDNIAEGYGRRGTKEFIHFLSISSASNDEVRSQLYRALDRGHIDKATFDRLNQMSIKNGWKIHNFISYLKDCEIRGQKFNFG